MRLLSKQEQELCRRILQGNGRNNYLANILDSYLPDAKITTNKEKQTGCIRYKMFAQDKDYFSLFERDAEIRRLILETVTLIKLLQQEGYIMLFMNTSEEPNSSIGAGPDELIRSVDGKEQTIEFKSEIKDASVIKLLAEYSSKEIYVTEEFKVFCENGYIPRSDVQFNQNLELTIQSLDKARISNYIAIATLIITFLSFLASAAASWGWRPSFFS